MKPAYCLFCGEALSAQTSGRIECPICRHEMKTEWLGKSLGALSRRELMELIISAAEYINRWKTNLYLSYKRQTSISSGFHDREDEQAEDEAVAVGQATNLLKEKGPELDAGIANLEAAVYALTGGELAQFLKNDLDYVRRVSDLYARKATPKEIRKLQFEIIDQTPWGAFGSHVDKPNGAQATKKDILARLKKKRWMEAIRSLFSLVILTVMLLAVDAFGKKTTIFNDVFGDLVHLTFLF